MDVKEGAVVVADFLAKLDGVVQRVHGLQPGRRILNAREIDGTLLKRIDKLSGSVTRDSATYNCPCVKTGDSKLIPTCVSTAHVVSRGRFRRRIHNDILLAIKRYALLDIFPALSKPLQPVTRSP